MQVNDDQRTTAQKALETVNGTWLADQMADFGITQGELCRELKIPQSTLSEILNDKVGRSKNDSARIKMYMEFRYRAAMRQVAAFKNR